MVETSLITQCPSVSGIRGDIPKGRLAFCHDTRQYRHPSLFVAFPGARHNPLEHVEPLLKQGCPIVVYEDNSSNHALVERLRPSHLSTCWVAVKDAVAFTQELGQRHGHAWQKSGGRVFAISGSNGKTTHKEMLAFLLQSVLGDGVVATEKNHNNHLGVPLTLLRVGPATKVCVLELGSNHPGEIKVLCDLATPDGGIVTNIGATHLEFFGSEEAVFEEEGFLFHALQKSAGGKAAFFQNMDDDFLKRLPRTPGTLTYSRFPGANLRFEVRNGEVEVSGKLGHQLLRNPSLTGSHNLTNMATAWAIATTLFPAHQESFAVAAGDFRPTANRSEWRELGGKKVYLDAYNANPSSMKVALEGFFEWLKAHKVEHGRAMVILGDMNELGDNAPTYHREVGEFLRRWPDVEAVFIGRFASHYLEGRGAGRGFADASLFKTSAWTEATRDKDHLFIKGSRSLQLESLLVIT